MKHWPPQIKQFFWKLYVMKKHNHNTLLDQQIYLLDRFAKKNLNHTVFLAQKSLSNLHISYSKFLILLFLTALFFIITIPSANANRKKPNSVPVNHPIQITSEIDPVFHFTISRDGKWMVYSTGRNEFSDLWIRSANPSIVVLPEQLTRNPSKESSPTFSPDGKFIAYVGTQDDVKGDIYILDLSSKKNTRLTDRLTEDGSPCFSPNGMDIYFHQAKPGDMHSLVKMSLNKGNQSCQLIETNGDGAFPSLSPDGTKLVFVSFRHDPNGDLFLKDLAQNTIQQLTNGPAIDFFPTWSSDSQFIVFTRIALDTNRDGQLNAQDHSVIYHYDMNSNRPPFPITDSTYSTFLPHVYDNYLFFLSDRGGITNCWQLPIEGQIPSLNSVNDQIQLAKNLSLMIPYDPNLTLLSYFSIISRHPMDLKAGATALLSIGKIYEQLDMPDAAKPILQQLTCQPDSNTLTCPYPFFDVLPERAMGQIALIINEIKEKLDNPDNQGNKKALIQSTLKKIDKIVSQNPNDKVFATAANESARLLFEYCRTSTCIKNAIARTDKVIVKTNIPENQLAEAIILRGDMMLKFGRTKDANRDYRFALQQCPNSRPWASIAINKILTIALTAKATIDQSNTISQLRQIADNNKTGIPSLAMGALNRLGDLYYETGKHTEAKSTYFQVLESFSHGSTQHTAARLALAEMFYKEERFRQALDLYETEIGLHSYEDTLYHLARSGYIRKSIEAGEFLYRLGEIPSARKKYIELLTYDDSIIEAHRGYIQCAASLHTINSVLSDYETRLTQNPEDPVALYATGLCLTYLNQKQPLYRAIELIEKAIQLNGQIQYFHQTLGYIYEILETAYNESNRLEMALEAYKKAYFLNDPKKNPTNAAHLSLNIGNACYLLKQYQSAMRYYSQRDSSAIPFDYIETRIMFYLRYGISSFQTYNTGLAIHAFSNAISILEDQMQPKAASDRLDAVSRFIMDHILFSALKMDALKNQAKQLAKQQSDINRTLSELTHHPIELPPSLQWSHYRKQMESLLHEQHTINYYAVKLLKSIPDIDSSDSQMKLTLLCDKVQAALNTPERFIQLKTEILDRLALAYQEAGQWDNAMKTFETVYQLNKQLGFTHNLTRNQRSVAYNTYMLAGTLSGSDRIAMLNNAAKSFLTVLSHIDTYGVGGPKKSQSKGGGLLKLNVQVALDDTASSQAVFGFTKDQEKRLAQVFYSRIQLELNNIDPALQTLQEQLSLYPLGKPIDSKDMFGVSLLYHRAAQLAFSQNKWIDAFDWFKQSASVSIDMNHPISAAINTANMANVLHQIVTHQNVNKKPHEYFKQLKKIDSIVASMFQDAVTPETMPILTQYHHQMGSYAIIDLISECSHQLSKDEMSNPDTMAVCQMIGYQRAVGHFHKAKTLLEKNIDTLNRKEISCLVSTYLNLAEIAKDLGDADQMMQYFQSAKDISERAVLPELQWRALVGLNNRQAALNILKTITLLRAGSQKQEIILSFAPMVLELVEAGDFEMAYELAETLSELERFHRLTPIFAALTNREKQTCRLVYERLDRMVALKKQLETLPNNKKQYTLDRIQTENKILNEQMPGWDKMLPNFIQSIENEVLKHYAVIIIGLAVHAEELAEAVLQSSLTNNDSHQLLQYDDLIKRYMSMIDEVTNFFPETHIMSYCGATPKSVMALMEIIPDHMRFIRIFKTGQSSKPYIYFTITNESVQAEVKSNIVMEQLDSSLLGLAYDYPETINNVNHIPLALSGTHFVRSYDNRKLSKHRLLAMPQSIVTDGYENIHLSQNKPSLPFNTLVIQWPVSMIHHVPTRENDYPMSFPGIIPDAANSIQKSVTSTVSHHIDSKDQNKYHPSRIPLQTLFLNNSELSLILFSKAYLTDAYILSHMAALAGCSTLIMPEQPVQALEPINEFLAAYHSESAFDAMQMGLGSDSSTPWRLFGYRGMTSDEALAYANEKMNMNVKRGIESFQSQHYQHAFLQFEQAIQIAEESKQFSQFLSQLYAYGMESAYLADLPEKAVGYAQKSIALIESVQPYSEQHARALIKLGLIQAKMEQYDKTIPLLEEAVDMTTALESETDQLDALTNLGIVLENATEYDRAIIQYQSALTVSEALNKREILASQHMNLGRLYDLRLSQYRLAIRHYQDALEIYKELNKTAMVSQAYLDIGRCQRILGDFHQAKAHFDEAMTWSQAGKKPNSMHLKIIIEQANLAWFQGDYDTAFKLQRESYGQAVSDQNMLLQIITLNTGGLIWWSLGKYDEAFDQMERALSVANSFKSREDEIASTLNNLGLVYRDTGQYEKALEVFHKALAIDEKLKSRWAIAYDLRNIGLTYLQMNMPDKAIPLLQQAVNETKSIGNRINQAKALIALGNALFMKGDFELSEKMFRQSLDLSKSMSLKETQWRALFGLSRIKIAENKPHDAKALLYEAIDIIEGMRAAIRIQQLRENFIDNKQDVYQTLVLILTNMNENNAAFDMAERSRSRGFIDLLGNQRLTLSRKIDQDLYDRQQTLKLQIEEHEMLIAQSTDDKEIQIYSDNYKQLVKDYQSIMLDIQIKNPELSAMISVEPIQLTMLTSQIEPHVALISYYVTPEEIICWIIPHHTELSETVSLTPVRISMNQNVLNQTIFEYRRRIQNIEPLEDMSHTLYTALVTPILQRIKDVTIIGVIPHGALHYLSFATLSDESHYLIDTHAIFYLPGCSLLNYTIQKRVKEKNIKVLALSNPDIGDPSFMLPFSEYEVESIQWNFSNITMLSKEKATEDWVMAHISEYGIIHIASHGEFDPINPLASSIKLSRGNQYDGNLQAKEVFSIKINADMVVLSACQTGLGKITAGDEIIGLNRAFFYAGTHTIVSSLWRVSDISTAILIKQFYRQYTEHQKAISLQLAIQAVRKRYAHPGYWGAFTVVGDYY